MNKLKTIMIYLMGISKHLIIGSSVLILLDIFTKGRAFELILYLSLMAISVAVAFAIPVAIAYTVAHFYERIDPDQERSFWISNAIRAFGLYEGFRSVHKQMYSHEEHSRKGHKYYKY